VIPLTSAFVSINSGGSSNFTINPSKEIEGTPFKDLPGPILQDRGRPRTIITQLVISNLCLFLDDFIVESLDEEGNLIIDRNKLLLIISENETFSQIDINELENIIIKECKLPEVIVPRILIFISILLLLIILLVYNQRQSLVLVLRKVKMMK